MVGIHHGIRIIALTKPCPLKVRFMISAHAMPSTVSSITETTVNPTVNTSEVNMVLS